MDSNGNMKGSAMIKQIKEYDIISSTNRMKRDGMKITMKAVAADIRHSCTNYDDYTNLLATDDAEQLIIETYKIVVSINKATAPAMKAWAQSKMKGLI